ncbi:MAG: tetratricopeptide repeat protein [Planctomycetia bacterium]|nr:tetratricopeptide repeat protein [Planctomycetia bacterium]
MMRLRRAGSLGVLLLCLLALPLLAHAAEKQSSEAAKRKFSDAVGMQREKQFNLAIDEYREFLKRFPQDPLAARARHYLAVCLIEDKRNPEAVETLTELVEASPDFEWLDEAYLNLGNAQYNLALAEKKPQGFATAAATYGKLLKKFPDSRFAAAALYSQGECLFAEGRKDAAVTAYAGALEKLNKAIAASKTSPAKGTDETAAMRADVLNALGATQLELNKPAEAAATFATFLTDYPTHAIATRIAMLQGDALFQQQKYGEAQKLFARAAADAKFPQADRAMMREADCLSAEKQFAQAADIFAAVAEKFPQSPAAQRVPLLAGNRYFLSGNYPAAIKWLSKVAQPGTKESAQAAHWLARAHLELKQPAEALAVLEKQLAEKNAAAGEVLIDLKLDQADALYDLPARRAESVAAYAAVAQQHPQAPQAAQALFNAAWAAVNLEKYDEALKHAQAFKAAFPNSPLATSAQALEADSLLNLNKPGEAAGLYRALIAKNPSSKELLRWQILLAWALRREQKHADVVTLLEPLVEKLQADRQAEAYYLLGASRFAQSQFKAARSDFKASLKADPNWTQSDEALLLLARCDQQLGNLKEAQAELRRLIAEQPKSPALDRAHYHLGEVLAAAPDYPAAAAEYQQVLKSWPSSRVVPQALYALGWTQLLRQAYAPAAESFTILIDKHPSHELVAPARFARAQALRAQGKNNEAVADLAAFLATHPPREDLSGALLERGQAEIDLQRPADAVKTLEAILADDPKYKNADKVLYNLGWAQRGAKHDAEAAAAFARLAKEYPDSPLLAGALVQLGEYQSAQKDYEAAAKSYSAALAKARPTDQKDLVELASHKLAWCHFYRGENEKARDGFAAQRKEFPNGSLAIDATFMEAECLLKLEAYDDAAAAYARVLAKPPQSPTNQVLAMLHAAQVASQRKKWDDALQLLTDAQKKFPEAPCKAEMLYELGWVNQNLKQLDKAAPLYEQVTDMTDAEVGARARLMLGELKFQQGDHAGAIRDYFKVFRTGYPNAPASYNRWKAQAAYEAARCFEVLKKPSEAQTYYQEVLDKYPQSELAPLARKRVAVLKSSS